jgi:hypothetical protein
MSIVTTSVEETLSLIVDPLVWPFVLAVVTQKTRTEKSKCRKTLLLLRGSIDLGLIKGNS